jgi:hypothetical protein
MEESRGLLLIGPVLAGVSLLMWGVWGAEDARASKDGNYRTADLAYVIAGLTSFMGIALTLVGLAAFLITRLT